MDASPFDTATDFHATFDPGIPGVVMVWRGYHTSASFRSCNERVLGLVREHAAPAVLCDIRWFLLIGATDQDWLNDDWLPRAMQAGLRRCAIVAPIYYFNRVAVETVRRRIDRAVLQVEYFDAPEPARQWLCTGARIDAAAHPRRPIQPGV